MSEGPPEAPRPGYAMTDREVWANAQSMLARGRTAARREVVALARREERLGDDIACQNWLRIAEAIDWLSRRKAQKDEIRH